LKTASTSPANTSTGTINIYFNYPVDTTVALPGNAANGNINFEDKLINRINNAVYSIDMAVYSFQDMPDIASALILAKNRGVKIRVVYDSRSVQNSMQSLLNAGILISQRPASLTGIMHDKFLIFDARDSIASNDWLWTGSWNITYTELSWKNNVVEINDPVITKAYQTEFEEMWGSTADTPNPAAAKFSYEKPDITPHSFSIGGRNIFVYFSPSDGTTSKILDVIYTLNHDFCLAMLTITRNDLADALHYMFNSGVKDIKGVVNDINDDGSQFAFLSEFADMHANPGETLHDKYALFDAEDLLSDPVVITGSHDWTNAAETENDENTLIIHDPVIANLYLQDFKKRYNDAGGTGTFLIPTGINTNSKTKISYTLYQNYPNPFNPVTTIRFEVPFAQKVEISIFDILGRKIKTLYDGLTPAGITAVDFKGDNLASGVYIYNIKAEGFSDSKKLLLVK
jgi:phosphatidylserine/phosphatidylglycerophosphate/cardiolipin synthase-like enzyme